MRFLSVIHESAIPVSVRARIQLTANSDFQAAACQIVNWAGPYAGAIEVASDGTAMAFLLNTGWCTSQGALKLQAAGSNLCPLSTTPVVVATGAVDACTPNPTTVAVAVTGPAAQFWARGVPITPTAAPAAVQTPALGYTVVWSIEPPLPEGLQMDPKTGIITGTPLFGEPATTRVIKATTPNGTGTTTFTSTTQGAANTITLSGVPSSESWVHGTAITNVTPTAVDSDGTITTFTWSIAPALPAGVSLAPSTGVISGTPTAATPAANYTLTATDRTGSSGSAVINITVT